MSFSPMDALLFCKKDVREKRLLKNILEKILSDEDAAPVIDENGALGVERNEWLKLNSIDMIPKDIEVKDSKLWKKKDLSKIEELHTIDKIFDWAFSSPYKGTIESLKARFNEINKEIDFS